MTDSSPTQDVDGSLNMSEVTFERICFTCTSDGQKQDAEGYCLDCCEHFCMACLTYHRILSATKHHKIIDRENMPAKEIISTASDLCTERCPIHRDEIIKFFCPTHKVLGCSVCVTLKHKLCNDVTYIPEAAADLSNRQEFKSFQIILDKLIKQSEYITKAAQSNIKLSADYREKAVQEIETYRQELNDTLDKLKKELEHKSEEIEVKDTEKMGIVADTINQVLTELQHMSSDIKPLLDNKQHCKLFIDMKNAENKLTDIQDRLLKAGKTFVMAFMFQPNSELQNLLQRKDAYGKLLVNSSPEINADFDLKYPDNIPYCDVTSAALLTEKKMNTDENNESVKLIDTEHEQIISEYKTEIEPFDFAIGGKTQIALTLPEAKQIQFLQTEDELLLDEEIQFGKDCWHVACVDDNLVISFSEPSEVKILNMTGEVLHTFATSSQGDRLFSRAPYLSVNSLNQAIYASDLEENRITMLDMDGNVKAVYEDADLQWPNRTAVEDRGMVYLCGTVSNNIHLLTPDWRKVKVLLSKRDGLKCPQDICYCKVTRRLYFAMERKDTIKVFQLF